MAQSANRDNVEAAHEGPDYAGAVAIIQQKIMLKKQDASKISGEISAQYAQIDKKRVDKAAARFITTLLSQEPENRAVTLRSVYGMIDAEPQLFEIPSDMVDQAEGKVIGTPNQRKQAKEAAHPTRTEKPPRDKARATPKKDGVKEESSVVHFPKNKKDSAEQADEAEALARAQEGDRDLAGDPPAEEEAEETSRGRSPGASDAEWNDAAPNPKPASPDALD